MKLKPLSEYAEALYPKAESKLLRNTLLLASMTATSLGGCGPAIDSRSVDNAVDRGDLDAAVECTEDSDSADCQDAKPETSAVTDALDSDGNEASD